MVTNDILDRKIEVLHQSHLHFILVEQTLAGFAKDINPITDRIDDFILDLSTDIRKEYCLLKFLHHFQSLDFEKIRKRYNENSELVFNKNKQLVIDHIALMLEELDVKFDTEIFSNKEFEALKAEISKLANTIFEFQTRQEASNEVIFNSVEEIKDQLISDAEKARIFGKEFVKQQLAGKLIEMSFKGGAAAFLNHLPSHLNNIQKFIGGTL
ncbi:hypothetical protein GCM10022216_14450 [Sphingobacterium kyonggiense]|uniref:Hemerythrin HHE cation binding domain-containing protein n=1 Tax=Sphingobacterium kyonggiense TaxID=714075 RepID=A0ABP7YLE2_9SPHI